MTRDQVKAILDRVLSWPEERQEDAVRILSQMEQQNKSPLRLSDAQVAEVKRRLAEPSPKVPHPRRGAGAVRVAAGMNVIIREAAYHDR